MIRHRTDEQVVSSAGQIDRAIAAGLTVEQVVALVAARHGWQILSQLDPTTINADLLTALRSPAAEEWDAIFVRRARRELCIDPDSVGPRP